MFTSDSDITHRVGLWLFPGFSWLGLAVIGVFEAANAVAGRAAYEIELLSSDGGPLRGAAGVEVSTRAGHARLRLDTLLIGGGGMDALAPSSLVSLAQATARRGARVASLCIGAFVLAQTGLLDGRRATTHWRWSRELQRRHREVKVDDDLIVARDGNVWSSGGMSAALDLALALVEGDLGAEVADGVARRLVLERPRAGGQRRFSPLAEQRPSARIAAAIEHARRHLADDLTLESLAEAAGLGLRQFHRALRAETGLAPAALVERLRVDAARERLAAPGGDATLESVARDVGFGDPQRMRRAFVRVLGEPPQGLRRAVRRRAAATVSSAGGAAP